MNNVPTRNNVKYQVDAMEEINKTGNGGYYDDDCFDVFNLDDSMGGVEDSKSRYILVEGDDIDQFGDEKENSVLIQVDDTINPYLVKTTKVSDDWFYPPPNKNKGDTNFDDVETLDIWSIFYFWPKFESDRYKAHYLPTGCVTVPKNENGEFVLGGWKFYSYGRKR